jgi:hypothetical protein
MPALAGTADTAVAAIAIMAERAKVIFILERGERFDEE